MWEFTSYVYSFVRDVLCHAVSAGVGSRRGMSDQICDVGTSPFGVLWGQRYKQSSRWPLGPHRSVCPRPGRQPQRSRGSLTEQGASIGVGWEKTRHFCSVWELGRNAKKAAWVGPVPISGAGGAAENSTMHPVFSKESPDTDVLAGFAVGMTLIKCEQVQRTFGADVYTDFCADCGSVGYLPPNRTVEPCAQG